MNELKNFSNIEILTLTAIAHNREMIDNAQYKKSFFEKLDELLIDIDQIRDRDWLPINDAIQAQMLAVDLRLNIQYSHSNIGIKINEDHIEELGEYLLQNEYDLAVHNRRPRELYYDTSKAIANVAAVIGLAFMQKMFREIFHSKGEAQ